MSQERDEVVELLGAWALGALEPDEAVAVEAALAADPELAAQARRLRAGVDALVATTAEAPLLEADATLRAALAVRRPGIDRGLAADGAAGPAAAYADQRDAFAGIAHRLDGQDWERTVAPYPWSAQELAVHLLAVETYFASLLGLRPAPAPTVAVEDHLRLAEPFWQAWRHRPPGAVVEAWEEVAQEVGHHLAAATEDDLAARLAFHGVDASLRSVVIVRTFELWTHADDLRRAVDRPLVAPQAPVLHTMADWSVGALPVADALLRPDAPGWRARVVLTGPGGGTWSVARDDGDAGPPDVLLVTDVVDYCQVASRRRDHRDLQVVVEGDRVLADHLLEAAGLFSV